MDPVKNPYNPGAGTQPPNFLGRDAVMRDFTVALRRTLDQRPGKSLMPIGLRGVGKTVLLNKFVDIAEEENCRVAFIEASETGDFRELLAGQIRLVLSKLDRSGPVSSAVKRALAALKSWSITIGMDGVTPTISIAGDPLIGTADSGILTQDLTELIETVGFAARDRKTAVVVAIDEVQYLTEPEFAAIISAIHRTTQKSLPVMLVGTGLPALPMLAGNAKSYAERLFSFPKITNLTPNEAKQAISAPALSMGVRFTEKALNAMVDVTKGYPYFIQEWAYEAWNMATTSPIKDQIIADVRQTVQKKLDSSFFSVRLDRLTPSERIYLRAMAQLGPGPHRSGDIAAERGLDVQSVAPVRSSLIKKGMVYSPAHGDTAFTVPLFDEFMRRRVPYEPRSTQTSKRKR